MIVVGKTGRGKAFNPNQVPNALELQGMKRKELLSKYSDYWTNTSCYASQDMFGRVQNAHFEIIDGKLCAVVELDLPQLDS